MKKSKFTTLVLITAALASCQKEVPKGGDWEPGTKKVSMRSDSTAKYSQCHHHGGGINPILWWYAFRPYGIFGSNGNYNHVGYYSGGINHNSNIGTSSHKSGFTSRGGFGGHGFSVSS